MESTELSPDAECNKCGYPIELATGINARIPSPGDVSLCIACGTPEFFIMCPTGMVTRSLTDDELAMVMKDENVEKAVAGINHMRGQEPDWPKGPRG
jgi:hypothetical protein